ncbi:hypothetical protein RA28_03190 [Ruegeria sp. ANG-S4]|uniref:hypothetical protein n=1 Tax=Ruegeria sp. ANG-S4 TaxID=1577904 RepID=UPI00057C8CAA|nr:hypothetical protein [Ruegeria sp. ANG-S4]KIC46771.1 hypothetical protein RA28_03190 [Ruegeria sp. ANG-S4]
MPIKSILNRISGKRSTYTATTGDPGTLGFDADPQQVKLTEADLRALFHNVLSEKQNDLPVRRVSEKQT